MDPESFGRGGPTLTTFFFLVDEGRDKKQKFSLAIVLSPIVVAKLQFFEPNLLFLRIWRQWRSVARTLEFHLLVLWERKIIFLAPQFLARQRGAVMAFIPDPLIGIISYQ